MTGNSSFNGSDNFATWLTNSTGNDVFTADYVRFNYIMVGVSIALLLIVIIIAKLLCVCHQEPQYAKVDLTTALRLKDDDTMMTANQVRAVASGPQDYGPRNVPGGISDDDDDDLPPYHHNDEIHGSRTASGATVWHTPSLPNNGGPPGHHQQQRSVSNSTNSSPNTVPRHVITRTYCPAPTLTRTSTHRSTHSTADPLETEDCHLLQHLTAVLDDDASPKSGASASYRRTKRFAWSCTELSSSAPSGASKLYLTNPP